MELSTYKSFLTSCKEKITEAMAPLRVREMRKKGELELCKIESSIAEKEQRIQEYAANYPINFDGLINALDNLELERHKLKQLSKILTEMFPEGE